MHAQAQGALGRTAAVIAEAIRKDISAGRFQAGQFLSPLRELAQTHEADGETVRRALKAIERDGLIAAIPRQGYRVLARAFDPDLGCPLALIAGGRRQVRPLGSMGGLMAAMGEAAESRGWSLLAAGIGGRNPEEILAGVRAARAFAIALDVEDPELVAAVRRSGIPAVMVNSFDTSAQLDSVVQDGFLGGVLAVQHLLGLGCERLGWFGNDKKNEHTRARFGGAAAAMKEAGLRFEDGLQVAASRQNAQQRARALLRSRSRPDGVVCLWRSRAIAFGRAARELGMRIGRDVHLVGWCPEELHEEVWGPAFGEDQAPAVITWSITAMAEAAVARLLERRGNPSLAPLRVSVPVRLRTPDKGGKS
jgi:DNA-binding LacI/PurR family transcriptional regulator